jgi:acyl-CoA synthetase (AMP-forming)/AMP-acid ligase II
MCNYELDNLATHGSPLHLTSASDQKWGHRSHYLSFRSSVYWRLSVNKPAINNDDLGNPHDYTLHWLPWSHQAGCTLLAGLLQWLIWRHTSEVSRSMLLLWLLLPRKNSNNLPPDLWHNIQRRFTLTWDLRNGLELDCPSTPKRMGVSRWDKPSLRCGRLTFCYPAPWIPVTFT